MLFQPSPSWDSAGFWHCPCSQETGEDEGTQCNLGHQQLREWHLLQQGTIPLGLFKSHPSETQEDLFKVACTCSEARHIMGQTLKY